MVDYKDTLHLPKTAFPLKADLAKNEPKILAKWETMKLYEKMHDLNSNCPSFVLHDGPPYANGNLHIGHALNKILKDATNRFQHALGKQITFTPGWDCHGLPIEWKVEEKYRKAKKDKDADVLAFRADCREYAAEWVDIQREQFKRFGIVADWDNPYLTMDFKFEAETVRQLLQMVEEGRLYRAERPVMWSPVEQTSLAEAEVEYKDIESVTADVRFPITKMANEYVVIWTTTPWTLPANKAIAVNPNLEYSRVSVMDGTVYWLASEAVERNLLRWGYHSDWKIQETVKGSELMKTVWNGIANEERPVLTADFVTADTGTGFVHIAPAHGDDDFKLGQEHGLDSISMVGPNGVYHESMPLVGGQHVFKCGKTVLDYLDAEGLLQHTEKIVHSYPHSWRSKKPIIYRTTPQWFISIDRMRKKALKEIDKVKWHPEISQNRIRSMVEGRGDWCVSRQRTWGVPLMMFVHKETGELLNNHKVNARVASLVDNYGCDVWYMSHISRFLRPDVMNDDDYEKATDVLDVWFDSGTTHCHVLNGPADLYMEGSDQHRGWFQSSLLIGVANEGKAPYKEVLTHGFVLDKNRKKMEKSVGNVVDPKEVIDKHGADVLRLWALSSDYHNDLTIGNEIVKRNVDMYRRIRNTMRYLLSNLQDHEVAPVKKDNLPELERYVLNELAALDQRLRNYVNEYNYHTAVNELHEFCNNTLSSFYFDIRKDSLYCDALDDPRRMGCMFVLDTVYRSLTAWFAPILPFTMEEVWSHRNYGVESVHLNELHDVSNWQDKSLSEKWMKVKQLRASVNAELEKSRADRLIGSPLEAHLQLTISEDLLTLIKGLDLKELFITGEVEVTSDAEKTAESEEIIVTKQGGSKCVRCWRIGDEHLPGMDVCERCFDATRG